MESGHAYDDVGNHHPSHVGTIHVLAVVADDADHVDVRRRIRAIVGTRDHAVRRAVLRAQRPHLLGENLRQRASGEGGAVMGCDTPACSLALPLGAEVQALLRLAGADEDEEAVAERAAIFLLLDTLGVVLAQVDGLRL